MAQMLVIFAYCGCGRAVNTEPKLSNEAYGTKHTECIFVEALRSNADSPHQFVLDVLLSLVRVNELSLSVFKRDGVHREVASREILKQGSAELYRVGPALIRIGRLNTIRGHLNNSELRVF